MTLLPTSNVPSIVTPLKVPVPFTTSVAPPAVVIVPPSTVPPSNTHEPLAAFSARVVLVLVSTPVRLTVPPLRVNAPKAANVKLPPRSTVTLVALIAPALVHAPLRLNVPAPFMINVALGLFCSTLMVRLPPLVPCARASLMNGCASMEIVPPLTSAEMTP